MSGAQTFVALIGDHEERITVRRTEGGHYEVEFDGVTHEVDAQRFAGGTWSLLIDRQSYDVELEVSGQNESDGEYNALVRGDVIRNITVQDERSRMLGVMSKRFSADGPQTLSSPMPGKVVKRLVEEGDTVEEGQPLIVIEAMKMENEIKSPKSGVITKIWVEPEETLESGAKLLTVE